MAQLHGLHHVTAVTGDVNINYQFYTRVLGLRLVKRTVNQDDTSAYHLFYADKLGSPGTDMTFFDWSMLPPNRRGTDSIVNTQFRVNGQAALDYWVKRLDDHQVTHEPISEFNGRAVLRFDDPEGQRLTLVDDGGAPISGEVWDGADVPVEMALRGFYAVTLSVPDLNRMALILTRVLDFSEVDRFTHPANPKLRTAVFAMDGGGAGKEVHVIEEPQAVYAQLGRGGVHHVAFRVTDDAEQVDWEERLTRIGVPTSGQVDRFYFKSLYFRISNGILFELATDGPGFAADEDPTALGERLALPPFLEPQRAQIEAGLKPITAL